MLTGLLLEYEQGPQRQGLSMCLCTPGLWWVPIILQFVQCLCMSHAHTHTHTLLICSLPGLKADKHVVMLQVKDKPQWGWECVSVNILIYTLKPACSTANKNMSMCMLWGNLISFILSSFFLLWVQGSLGYFLLTAICQPIRRIIDECQQVSTVLLNQGALESLINALKHFSWYFCLINGNNFPPICYF